MTLEDVRGGPLEGIRVLEVSGLGPAPYACLLLAELGADVVRLERPGDPSPVATPDVLHRSRPAVVVDLATDAGRDAARTLAARADVFVESARPGVMERLGLGPEDLVVTSPRLVYARLTGWGQDGPLAGTAGHDITYAAVAGALHLNGDEQRPLPAANLVADFAGGALFLVAGVLAALLERERSGRGQVVDAAMVDGTASLTTMFFGLLGAGRWRDRRRANLLDGGAPFYDTYRCSDGRFVAVGALEPRFYRALLDGLGLSPEGEQYDESRWPELRTALTAAFATLSRDEWVTRFAGTDACVAPVLALAEAPVNDHLAARGAFVDLDGVVQPVVAPRFSRTPGRTPTAPPRWSVETALSAWGAEAVSGGTRPLG